MNLVTNASEAVGDRAGVILIRTSLARMGKVSLESDAAKLPTGDYVQMVVSDTGAGMTPEVQARIFDPFFTTKVSSRGRGLGLAITHGIVRNHGGEIHVSASSNATAFKVWLPCAARQPTGPATR
jgi:signal transduction histidine kinase